MEKILNTKDYGIFKTVRGNRDINGVYLSRLVRSISTRNILPQNPIIVNKDMQVIDGQHRLAAAQALGLPVYYTIAQDSDLEVVQLLNSNTRKWLLTDYLRSYVALGKKEYIRLQEFSEEYHISESISLVLLSGIKSSLKRLQDFRDGKFVVRDYEKAENLASILIEIRKFSPDRAWVDRNLMKAVVFMVEKVDPKRLLKNLNTYGLKITRRLSTKEYLAEFEEIINLGGGSKVTLV